MFPETLDLGGDACRILFAAMIAYCNPSPTSCQQLCGDLAQPATAAHHESCTISEFVVLQEFPKCVDRRLRLRRWSEESN